MSTPTTVPVRPADTPARPPLLSPRAVDLAVLFLYLLLAVWIVNPLWRDPGHLDPATNTTDPAFFEAALVHATRIFTHGENPFLAVQLNAPVGINMMANTGLLGLTVPLVPVTLLFGPAVSVLLLLVLGLAGTAAAWYWVLSRHVLDSRLAAAVGGGFCGFAPGMVNHTNGHPNLVVQFLLPFIAWRALSLREPGPVLRRGVLLGLLIAWQALLNEELLFLFALALGIFVLAYGLFRPAELRAGVRSFCAGIAVAGTTALVLLIAPLIYEFLGAGHYRGLPDFVLGYGTDLASFPAFAKLSLVGGDGTLAHQPEENAFLGWPLLLALLVIAVWLWRMPAVRALLITGVVFAALSLGATVNWHGHALTTHGPWSLLNKLPLFDTVVPTRLTLLVIPVVGVLLGLSISAAEASGAGWRYGWLAVVVLVLLPIAPRQLPVVQRPAVPRFYTDGAWHRYVHGDDSILSADTTVWYGGVYAMQADNATGQGFRMIGGYFLGPDDKGRGQYGPQYRPTSALLFYVAYDGRTDPISDQQRAQAVMDFRYWRTAIVVLAPDAPHADELRSTLNALVGAGQQVEDVWLWDVRPLWG